MCIRDSSNPELGNEIVAVTGDDEGILETANNNAVFNEIKTCLLYTSPSPRDRTRSRMPSSA